MNQLLNLPYLSRRKRKYRKKISKRTVTSGFLDESNDSSAETMSSSETEDTISSGFSDSVTSMSYSTSRESTSTKDNALYEDNHNKSTYSMPVII